MDQRISLITLGVADLPRSRRFYEAGLGWKPVSAMDAVCFYQLPGMVLGRFGREALAEDAKRPIDGTFSGVTIAINGRDRAEVDTIFAEALAAGAKALKPPEAAGSRLLGRLFGLFRRPRRARLGSGAQSGRGDRSRRRHALPSGSLNRLEPQKTDWGSRCPSFSARTRSMCRASSKLWVAMTAATPVSRTSW